MNLKISIFHNTDKDKKSYFNMKFQEERKSTYKDIAQCRLKMYEDVNLRSLFSELLLTKNQKTSLQRKLERKFDFNGKFRFGVDKGEGYLFFLFQNLSAIYSLNDKRIYVGSMNLNNFKMTNSKFTDSFKYNTTAYNLGSKKPSDILPIEELESVKTIFDYESEITYLKEELNRAYEVIEKNKIVSNKVVTNGRTKVSSSLIIRYDIENKELKEELEFSKVDFLNYFINEKYFNVTFKQCELVAEVIGLSEQLEEYEKKYDLFHCYQKEFHSTASIYAREYLRIKNES